MTRFFQTCLLFIVLLLTVIAFEPILTPQRVRAAQHKYIAVEAWTNSAGSIQAALDKYSADGWELTAVTSTVASGGGRGIMMFFQK
jgi:hypothetical protein